MKKHTQTDSQIDDAINELGVVMNGGIDPGVEVPPFTDECMIELRAIIRKLIAHAA